MPEFLITDARNNVKTWVSGATVGAALLTHENDMRTKSGDVLLPKNSKIGRDTGDGPNVLRAWIGCSRIAGRVESVVREVAP